MGVLESLSELVLNVKKEKIDKAIKDSKKTKNWREVEALPSYQKLDANEINLFAINYKKNIIDKSKKFKKLPEEKQQEILQQWQDRTTSQMFEAAKKKPVANIPLVNAMNLGGIPVEKAAQFIEPDLSKITADTSSLGIGALAARQGTAEFMRFHKPWNLLAASAAGQVLQKVVPPVAKAITKIIPSKIKDPIARFFTTGKGQPIAYQALRERNILGKAEGGREAEAVAKTLSIAPKDITIKLKNGTTKLIKKGQPIPAELQRYAGRIFRKEIDTSGLKSRLGESVEKSAKIGKNVEVEVAFNPKVQGLNKQLEGINKALRSKKAIAESKIGTVIETKPGNFEKITGIKQATKTTQKGVIKKLNKYDLISEPISPTEAIKARILPKYIAGEKDVLRGVRGLGKENILSKGEAATRKHLLQQRKIVSKQLEKEIFSIETNVRAKYDIFDTTFVDKIKNHPKYKVLKEISDEGRVTMDKWSKELIKSGVPTKEAQEAIEKNVGNYMARMYSTNLFPETKGFRGLAKNLRLRLNGLKHRKDLSEKVRKALGEIKEPALPTALRVKEISDTVQNSKLFSAVANNSEWVANTNVTGKMVQLAKTPELGALKGKWVVESIANDVSGLVKVKDVAPNLMGILGNAYTKGYSKWKYGKVVLNPATHVRNMVSNSMLLDLSGVNHFQQAKLMRGVWRDYKAKGKMYQLALKHGAIGGEFVGTEVAAIAKQYTAGTGGNLSKWMNVLKTKGFTPAQMYQGEEQIAKMIKFTHMIKKGATPALAAKEAQKWLFNYSKIPDIINVAKQASPFITFTYKALPRIGEAMANNPLKVYKYYALFKSWNEMARKLNGLTPEEFAREQDALPPWLMKSVGGVPMTLMMPWRDKHNRSQWLNLEYMLPIGMAPEVIRQGAAGLITNPLYSLVSDLSKNKDFKDQDIIPEGTPKGEAFKIATNYIYKQLAPSLAPGIKGHKGWEGGYSWSKILNSMEKIPDYADRIRSVPSALLDSLVGFKLTPVDINESEYFSTKDKNSKTRDIQNQIRRLNHPAISEEYREKRAEELFKRIQKIWGN